jgi:transcriptional regulator with XRE-family HTH domain
MDHATNGMGGSFARTVNDDMRRAAANLAIVIKECGLSQSELARRSGLSRQLINGWACQRLSVTLSATVARLLSSVKLSLGDLLLGEQDLYARLGKSAGNGAELSHILPRLVRNSKAAEARKRLNLIAGTFRYRTRLKESPMFVLERTFQFRSGDDHSIAAMAFDGSRVGNKPFAEGNCYYHQSTFYIFVECTDPPYQPLFYAYRDLNKQRIMSLNGVSIAPGWFGPDTGSPLTRLVYMHRTNPDGSPLSEPGFDPEREFNTFIPVDACTVLTT